MKKLLLKLFLNSLVIGLFAFCLGFNSELTYSRDTLDCSSLNFSAGPISDRLNSLCIERESLIKKELASTNGTPFKETIQIDMIDRQFDVARSYYGLKERIDKLRRVSIKDPRLTPLNDALKKAETVLYDSTAQSFLGLDVTNDTFLLEDPYRSSPLFNDKEKVAIGSLNEVNRVLISPSRPGSVVKPNEGSVGGVPEGDLINDFIPGIIRLLFRFASLVVFISFLASGIMLIAAFGNDERLSKAKRILYYSLVGFAILTLAFAIVKAITDIDFFGFI